MKSMPESVIYEMNTCTDLLCHKLFIKKYLQKYERAQSKSNDKPMKKKRKHGQLWYLVPDIEAGLNQGDVL